MADWVWQIITHYNKKLEAAVRKCNTPLMASVRAPGRKSISVWLDDHLLQAVEHACRLSRLDRSKFLRDAVISHLRNLGFPPEFFYGAADIKTIVPPMKKVTSKINIENLTAADGGTNNVSVHYREAAKPPKEKYAEGTIGRNAHQRNYVAYLLGQYYEFKKADVSFGADPLEHARIMNGLYPIVNNTIRKLFGAYPNGLPEEKFPALVSYMQDKIDGTRLGRKQKKAGHQNYKTFEEFCALGGDAK